MKLKATDYSRKKYELKGGEVSTETDVVGSNHWEAYDYFSVLEQHTDSKDP